MESSRPRYVNELNNSPREAWALLFTVATASHACSPEHLNTANGTEDEHLKFYLIPL